jgi:hypothetical protein
VETTHDDGERRDIVERLKHQSLFSTHTSRRRTKSVKFEARIVGIYSCQRHSPHPSTLGYGRTNRACSRPRDHSTRATVISNEASSNEIVVRAGRSSNLQRTTNRVGRALPHSAPKETSRPHRPTSHPRDSCGTHGRASEAAAHHGIASHCWYFHSPVS